MSTEDAKRHHLSTLLHLSIELFFAVLPLFVLGAVWPEHGAKHPEQFIAGPEWSMTACVLYGLALARLQLGAVTPAREARETRALGLSVLSLLPLSGVIVSVILITQFAQGNAAGLMITFQLVNLVASGFVFLVIGGYGISRSANR